ncbi:hypothetical protein TMatcc_000128 [Talaromyces marneffei ATCC 18224]|uniref:uncharacterized protein n=1 Tax=Talaromyces marneffei TaxID=37727 RepID=UPI0012A8872B|nr:uncharacterized protein EYB26_005215 [Talaromyces marneffei]KAE8549166.1 hypothetical protein EYB25_007681 [Talaromyces marneffei]QGA17544.1 hypothetical protein EYB26_005215 [Talaromyces marneffei]
MAQSDGESGRNSPDYPSQIIGATLNGGSSESRRRSGSNDSEVSTPSLADEIFSPSASIVTDITEDYGWETPVKRAPIPSPQYMMIISSGPLKMKPKTNYRGPRTLPSKTKNLILIPRLQHREGREAPLDINSKPETYL